MVNIEDLKKTIKKHYKKVLADLSDNNPESFSNAIKRILSDEPFRNELIANGIKVTKEISSESMEEKEKDLYLKLLKKD